MKQGEEKKPLKCINASVINFEGRKLLCIVAAVFIYLFMRHG